MRAKLFYKAAVIDALKATYLVSDNIIHNFKGNNFCLFFNIRSWLLRWEIRFEFDKVNRIYYAKSNGLRHVFLNRRQALNAYRISLAARATAIANTYHLNQIEFTNGDKIIDCGANVGDLLLYFKLKKIDINYIAFEPSPLEYRCLTINAAPNKPHNAGLWNNSGVLKFYISSDGADSSFVEPVTFDSIKEVGTLCLDSMRLKDIKLLKLEAEGGEPEVMAGAVSTLQEIEYISADLGFERGITKGCTLPEVATLLIQHSFKFIDINPNRMVALFIKMKV